MNCCFFFFFFYIGGEEELNIEAFVAMAVEAVGYMLLRGLAEMFFPCLNSSLICPSHVKV